MQGEHIGVYGLLPSRSSTSRPLIGPTDPMSPGHGQVLQGILVETIAIIGIRCHLISDGTPIHRRRSGNILGSPLHLALGTPLDELDSWRTRRTARLYDHLLQRNQRGDCQGSRLLRTSFPPRVHARTCTHDLGLRVSSASSAFAFSIY
jgi:hypothetical protein